MSFDFEDTAPGSKNPLHRGKQPDKRGGLQPGKAPKKERFTLFGLIKDIISLGLLISFFYGIYLGGYLFYFYNEVDEQLYSITLYSSKTIDNDAVIRYAQEMLRKVEPVFNDPNGPTIRESFIIDRAFDQTSISFRYAIKVNFLWYWPVTIAFTPTNTIQNE